MKLKLFQRQDLARAALHDGLILSWDTGLGKTWAMFLWPLLKCGFVNVVDVAPGRVLKPKAPVLIVAPGDLHQQIAEEAWSHFRIRVVPLGSQETFMRLTRRTDSHATQVTEAGRPMLAPDFYLTSYTQLTTNGVQKLPDAQDWDEPVALMQWLGLKIGEPQKNADPQSHGSDRPDFRSACEFFAWRGLRWFREYRLLNVDVDDTESEVKAALARELDLLSTNQSDWAARQRHRLRAASTILMHLVGARPCPRFADLSPLQQNFVLRHFCAERLERCAQGIGEIRTYAKMADDQWRLSSSDPEPLPTNKPCKNTDAVPSITRKVKCVHSPSLSDLCYDAFDCVVIDEAVKIKGEDTCVGRGVRQLEPKYRLVLTATPVKNRLPDIFRLAWWAAGGQAAAHARFPYRDDSSEREKFARTFMVSERNVSKEAAARARGERVTSSRYKKLTAEVCNVHRLWKLLAPIVLRRRKQDAGAAIVPKIRRVIRCEMGTLQQRVYQYHLQASYTDRNGETAVGAQLQALRMAAADPTSEHLLPQVGRLTETCGCTRASHSLLNLAQPDCPHCHGGGEVPLPHRSGQSYIPKIATTLTLIQEILERKEQVIVFSALNDPLDNLSRWLTEAGVRHVTLDGRTSQKQRGKHAAIFKRGRISASGIQNPEPAHAIPVMLAGVECMAEGHSFHLANNVILIAYSWAYDKFKQALDRVHRMNSEKRVNMYVVLCTGTIDRKLESLVQDKGDAAELVLDGRLIGERTEEINLAELLRMARREFDEQNQTLDEARLQAQWPALRERLHQAMLAWDATAVSPAAAAPESPDAFRVVKTADDWRSRVKVRVARLTQLQSPDLQPMP